ncbi:MAG TPA: glycosyltransferase, partial [Gammaproteobacteria bacterium]|nr:glycosyltransferase [Gammaproteobacteria bacterium]
ADRISVIWNGAAQQLLDLRHMSPQGKTRTVIFTGNLASYQGIDLMLQAFASLRATRRDVRLLIVSADRFTDYEVLARELGIRDAIDVTQAGFDRVPEHLARADIALNPRIDCPGVPQKLLNYMAAGMPIVSFAGSGRFLAAGEHGIVVRDGDTEGFAQAMARLLDDHALARRLGNSAQRFAAAELSWSRAAELTEKVYASVLGKTGKSLSD